MSRFFAELSLCVIYYTDSASPLTDWLTLMCLCLKNELWPQQLLRGSGSNHLPHSLFHSPLAFTEQNQGWWGLHFSLIILVILKFEMIRLCNFWLNLLCPHSISVSSHLFWEADGSEIKSAASFGLHTWPAHLVVPIVTDHHWAIRSRGNKNPECMWSCVGQLFPSLSGIMICTKRGWNVLYLSEAYALWKTDPCVRFIPGIFVVASVMHILRWGKCLTMPEAICHPLFLSSLLSFSFLLSCCKPHWMSPIKGEMRPLKACNPVCLIP